MKRIFWVVFFLPLALIGSSFQSESGRVWIFFQNRSVSHSPIPLTGFSRGAIQRRALRAEVMWDEMDLPVSADYMSAVTKAGARIYRESRWLNAVSAYCDHACQKRVSHLPFVSEIRIVETYHRHREPVAHGFESSSAELAL